MNWGFCDCASICGHQRSRVCLMKFPFLWRNHADSKGRKSDNTDHSSMITQGTVAAKKALTATMQGVVFSDLQKRTRSWVFLRFQGKKKIPNLMACLVDCFIMMHLGFSWFSIDLFRLGLIVLKGPAHQEPVFSVMRAFSNGRPGVRPPKFRKKKKQKLKANLSHESSRITDAFFQSRCDACLQKLELIAQFRHVGSRYDPPWTSNIQNTNLETTRRALDFQLWQMWRLLRVLAPPWSSQTNGTLPSAAWRLKQYTMRNKKHEKTIASYTNGTSHQILWHLMLLTYRSPVP